MIKIKSTDTILDILEQISNCQEQVIVLDFPFGHPILHNHLSLKIIKARVHEKKLVIVTPDITSRSIGKPLGIEYSLITDQGFYEEQNTKGKILKYNFSFLEYFLFEIKKYARSLARFFTHNKRIEYYSSKYAKQKSGIGFFLLALGVSCFLLVFIFYFAVTKTYVSISPEISVRTRAKNIIFQERDPTAVSYNDNLVPLLKVSKMVYLDDIFGCTGVDEKAVKKSSGKVKIINELPEEVQIKPKTRLLADNGVIFETIDWITIPSAVGGIGSSVETTAVSQLKDIDGKLIGENANIGVDEILTLPGLTSNKDKIYAKSIEAFTGGENYMGEKLLTSEDIENAKKLFSQKLKNEALKSLKDQIKLDNNNNNVTYTILGVNNIISYKNEEIVISNGVEIGKTINSFPLSGSITIETYVFNTQSVLSKLGAIVKDSIIDGSEKLLLVNESSLRIASEIYRQTGPLEIKATMEVEALIVHDFGNNNDNYVQKIKSMIIGLSEEEATKFLVNDSYISNAKVQITPFFVRTISNIPENIIFEIDDSF